MDLLLKCLINDTRNKKSLAKTEGNVRKSSSVNTRLRSIVLPWQQCSHNLMFLQKNRCYFIHVVNKNDFLQSGVAGSFW